MAFAACTFTGTDGTTLASHNAGTCTGHVGVTWTKHSGGGSMATTGGVGHRSAGTSLYYINAAPASADYDVEATITRHTNAQGNPQVVGRLDTVATTYYALRYLPSTNEWRLYKNVAGTLTQLGASYTDTLADGNSRTAKLEMRGTTIKAYTDGVERLSATDLDITAAGRAGIGMSGNAGDATTGQTFDDFSATDSAAVYLDLPVASFSLSAGGGLGVVTEGGTGERIQRPGLSLGRIGIGL